MRQRLWVVLILIHLFSTDLFAKGVLIKAEFRSPRVGVFKYTLTVTGPEAERFSSPTDRQMRPYLLAAQKALAEREGYPEKIYGPEHYKLPTGIKYHGITALDAQTGTEIYSSPN